MLKSIGYPDHRVAQLMVEGFPLVGDMDETNVFESRPKEGVVQGADIRWLYQATKEVRSGLIKQIQAEEITDVSKEVCKKTIGDHESEVARGWASGPFTEEELNQRHGPLWLCCRRIRAKLVW